MEMIEMPETEGNTIASLCAGKRVLMIGVDVTSDVVEAAAAARSAVICPDTGSGEWDTETAAAAHLRERLAAANLAGKTLVTRISPLGVVSTFLPGQFDVALLDPVAAGLGEVGRLVGFLVEQAPTVVVVADNDPAVHGIVANARAGRVGITVTDGRFVIARSSVRLENGVY